MVQVSSDLQFGVFDWVDKSEGTSLAELYEHRLDMLRAADEGEFSVYHVAEHHGSPLGLAASPVVFLSAASQVTSRIRLAPTVLLLGLYDPLRVTQEICMLDHLAGGRLELGIGRGSSPYEAAMYGLTPADMAQRYADVLPQVLHALRTGELAPRTVNGREVPAVQLHVRPFQQPHPPLWYPTTNPESIPRIGKQGLNTIFSFGFNSPPLEEVRRQREIYFENHRAAAEEGGHPDGAGPQPRFGIMRHVFVADTDAEAEEVARPAFMAHYANFAHSWRAMGSDRYREDVDFDALIEQHRLFVGSPETVRQQVAAAVEVTGINYFAGAFAWGSLDPQDSLRSIRIFRDDVIPHVRQRLAGKQPAPAGSAAASGA